MKKLFYILALLVVMLPFQNCGVLSSLNPGQSLSSNVKSSESGNGGGYEGKPDGTYYHFIPSYTCEGNSVAEQVTEIKNGQAYLYTNKDNQCSGQSAPVAVSDVDISPFQKEFISVKDSLFKRYDAKPVGIPTNLAEVLCRDDFEHPTFEIVSHFDREKNEAMSRVYLADQKISDFAVSRILSMNEVRYVSNNISFRVDLTKPAYPDRKFAGRIESTSISKLSPRPLVCVIGGSVDTSKWSLKALTNRDVGSFQVMKNNEIVFFSAVSKTYYFYSFYTYISHLFKIGVDNIVSDFSKLIFGDSYNVIYQNGTVSDVLYMYGARSSSEAWTSDFFYDSRTGKLQRLTNLIPGALPEAYSYAHPVLTSDQHLFYDTYVLHEDMSRDLKVKAYDFADSSVTDVVTLGERNDNGYVVLPKTNKLVVVWRETDQKTNVIQIYDALTKRSTELPAKVEGGCFVSGYDLRNIADETAILGTVKCLDGESLVKISLVDGTVKTVAKNSKIEWMSDDLNRIVVTDGQNQYASYDFRTEKKIVIPVRPHFGEDGLASGITDFQMLRNSAKMVLSGDRYLYGFGGSVDAPTMYRVDLTSGAGPAICDSAIGKKLYVGVLPNQKVFLLTYDTSLKVYRFYQAKSSGECQRINEFPSDYAQVPSLQATNIGFALVLGAQFTKYTNESHAEAVFVPIDGRPPLKFNPNAQGYWSIEVSADKNRLVMSGPDTDGETKIFSFDL